MAGRLVVFEGIDGGGKTTLLRSIAAELRSKGAEVVETKEPTDGPLGQRIRAIARTGRAGITPEEELRLFHEDRRQHVAETVRPAIARGAIVLQDRTFYSTVAYQGDRGLDRERILRESRAIAPEPDLLVIVDVDPRVALERIRRTRSTGSDDFETLEGLERVRSVFLGFVTSANPQSSKEGPFEVLVLDGTKAPEALRNEVLAAIDRQSSNDRSSRWTSGPAR